MAYSAFGTWTVLLTGVLELIATCLALAATASNNALFLFLGIRALRPAGICVRPAICLAVIC
jgi:uncharacterized membrane protein HdeD (DUF308 family)